MKDKLLIEKYKQEWAMFKRKASELKFNRRGLSNDYLDKIGGAISKVKESTVQNIGLVEVDFSNCKRKVDKKELIDEKKMIEFLYASKVGIINGQLGIFIAGVYVFAVKKFEEMLKKINCGDDTKESIKKKNEEILFEFEKAGLAIGLKIQELKSKSSITLACFTESNSLALKMFNSEKDPEQAISGQNIEHAVNYINKKLSQIMEKLEELDGFLQNARG